MAIGEVLLQGVTSSGRPVPVKVEADGRLSINQSDGVGGTGVDPVAIKDGADPTHRLAIDAQGRITANVTFPLVQEITGSVAAVGPLRDDQLRAAPVVVSGTVTANVGSGTQAVSGAVTADTELPAPAALSDTDPNPTTPTVGSSGLVWNGSAWVRARGGLGDGAGATGMQNVLPMLFNGSSHDRLRGDTANGLDVDVTRLPALPAGTNNIGDVDVLTLPPIPAGNNNIGDVDVATLPALTALSTPGNSPHAVTSLGNSLGKTNVLKTGNLVTTAVTADQVILTYTVTAGKTFYLQYFTVMARLTTFAATATFFGAASLESPAATKLFTMDIAGTGVSAPLVIPFDEPVPITAGTVIRVVCTPSAVTSMTWKANFGGYEK